MASTITYWQEPDGMWLGYWNDYPDYQTEGHTFDDLKRMLISLRDDIREMISDAVPCSQFRAIVKSMRTRPGVLSANFPE